MASFIPSYIQKRLLRYALSRLELLDTDALDLERLEIGWGRRSTIELRDVGLQKQKLYSLLQLPTYLKVEKTNIRMLRLTVPADIHTSPIVVDITGVEIGVSVVDNASPNERPSRKRPRPGSPAVKKETDRRGNTSYDASRNTKATNGGNDTRQNTPGGHKEVIPTPHDLAKSFLEQEPKKEKAQLEAELASRSVDLNSTTSSENMEDDSAEGTGVGFTLPSFLAGFLTDVLNRLQVQIKDIEIRSRLDIEFPADVKSQETEKASASSVTFKVRVRTADIEGLTTHSYSPAGDTDVGGSDERTKRPNDSRCVFLKTIDSFLIVDRNLLHLFSQTSYKDELSRDQASTVHSLSNSTKPGVGSHSPRLEKSSDPYAGIAAGDLDNSTVSDLQSDYEPTSSLQPSLVFSDGGNLADAEDEYESGGDAIWSHEDLKHPVRRSSRARFEPAAMGFGSPDEVDRQGPSRHMHNALSSFRQERLPSTHPQPTHDRLERAESPRTRESSRRTPLLSRTPGDFETATVGSGAESSPLEVAAKSHLADTRHGAKPEEGEEMIHSKAYTQQGCESIYMSVVDDSSGKPPHRPPIPGAWNSESFQEAVAPPNTGSDKIALDDFAARDNETRTLLSKEEHIPADEGGGENPDQDRHEHERYRGLARIPLLSIDHLRLWLPCEEKSSSDDHSPVHESSWASRGDMSSADSRKSTFNTPGAFSLYAESIAAERRRTRPSVGTGSSDKNDRGVEAESHPQSSPKTFTKIDIGPTCIQLDPVSSKLLHRVSRRCQDIVESSRQSRDQRIDLNTAYNSTSLNMSVETAKMSFMDDTCVLPINADDVGLQNLRSSEKNAKSLFDLNLGKLSFQFNKKASKLDFQTDVQSLSIEFAGQPLLQFDREAKMRASVRDQGLGSNVLSIAFSKKPDVVETTISTSVLVIDMNFVELDQTLTSYGGFSGLIDLGSSILSETGSNNAPVEPPRQRSVRFETTGSKGKAEAAHSRQKINMRIGGSSVTMKGEACKVDFQSSAIKAVGRDSAFAVQIDNSLLIGPTSTAKPSDETVRVRCVNLSLKYLSVPEETDLSNLISLLSPSRDKFEEEDDYLVDTLISQRRRGSVMRFTVTNVDCAIPHVDKIRKLADFANEVAKLSTVTKYLPQETRPGVLTIGTLYQLDVSMDCLSQYRKMAFRSYQNEIAHVSAPSLFTIGMSRLSVHEDTLEKIIHQVTPSEDNSQRMLMARFIGEEMEPTVKVKLWNVCFEYSVPFIMKAMGIDEIPCTEDFTIDLAASVANIADQVNAPKGSPSHASEKSVSNSQPLKLNVSLRDCGVGLLPRDLTSKALLILTSCGFSGSLRSDENLNLNFDIGKATLLLIDDKERLKPLEVETPSSRRGVRFVDKQQISQLSHQGYVSICWVSAASAIVKSYRNFDDDSSILDVEFRDELFVLETCADSTQTLIELAGALQPPKPPSKGTKYRTEVEPIQDMMASFTGDAFAMETKNPTESVNESAIDTDSDDEGDLDDMRDIVGLMNESEVVENDPFASPPLSPGPENMEIQVDDDTGSLDMEQSQIITGGVQPSKLKSQVQGMAWKWNSNNNRYIPVTKSEIVRSPFKLKIKDMNLIWNLHDGYDWQGTRDTISKAVGEVEAKAEEKRTRRKISRDTSDDEESVIGDFLFNSIYIGVPVNHDPRELARQINRDVDDNVSETTSQPTTVTSRPAGAQPPRPSKRLKLGRSKRHKITIELRGLSSDVVVYPSGGETLSSTDVRVRDIEVFDHVPTSTWKKFATYWHESDQREDKKPMLHLELCDVRPVPELTASELVLRVTILPLRLHVDQDALDFMTRFFDFHDDAAKPSSSSSPSEQPYLQRVEVRPVALRLDYKPKKVDYAGLRSGRTTEFMNFFILDSADILLKHTIIYGSSNFARLHKSLEDVWMPDVKMNQLPSVLSGLNGVRTVVNVSQGVRALYEIPVREYKKDGRLVRSISKGAAAFAKTTSSELTKFGAKLAVGAHGYLQGAEEYLSGNSTNNQGSGRHDSSRRTSVTPGAAGGDPTDWDHADLDDDSGDEPKRAISRYADQPAGILQGLRGAARNLERDLLLTRDVIVAVSGEIKESGSATGAARAVGRAAPTIVLRPLVGVSGAVGKTLLGAANSVDEANYRRVGDKYKRR